MIAIWLIASWEIFGKPKRFNIIELGPGDGSLTKILLETFKRFKEFNSAKKIYLYEKSNYLIRIQKKKICNKKVKWIKNFDSVTRGPVIFLGNEFFDAIPIKQFKKIKNSFLEKNYIIDKNNNIKEVFQKTSDDNSKLIRSFSSLKKLKFIEFPKLGFKELKKIINKIIYLKGCILLIDYGYLKSHNKNTLQSVMKHKKNNILDNLGKADVTSHVNFELLKEFFSNNNLKTENTIYQERFLKNMGILDRANGIAKRMKFSEQTNLYMRLKRLISENSMGNLFKVVVAHNLIDFKIVGFK